MENNCIFCKIIAGEIPAEKVFEDEHAYAFLDIHPVNKGHTLVVPKTHAENMYDISPENFCTLMETVRKLSPIVKKAVSADGINIGINNGGAAGQIIFHTHVHIIPRYGNDGFRHWHGTPYEEGGIQKTGEIIRDAQK
jgi:histidine triad (HIT) family protein